jgi:hypothetical protein
MDMAYPIPRPGRGGRRTAVRIMAYITGRTRHADRRAAN